MVQFINLPQSRRSIAYEMLSESLGSGVGNLLGDYFANKSAESVINNKSLQNAPLSERYSALERALAPHGQRGQNILQRRLGIESQRAQEQQQSAVSDWLSGKKLSSRQEELIPAELRMKKEQYDISIEESQQKERLRNQKDISSFNNNYRILSERNPNKSPSEIVEEARDLTLSGKTLTPTAPKQEKPLGGLSGIAVPPEISQKIGKVLEESKDLNADELRLRLDQEGIPPSYSNPYIENRRRGEDIKSKEFEGERAYHTGFSKDIEKDVNKLRDSLPKKETALDFARDAIETGNLRFFSADKLADATGLDVFRTAKGAQLITAGKENLLSNMARTSARAQNLWFEQRLNSMFPKIGQSQEANLTVQEMLDGEVAMDRAYLNAFDKLAKEDEDKYGYVKKDISRRAHDVIKPLESDIIKRTTYRMKQIEEQEKGLADLKKQVGKNVTKGTPLTLAMAKLYKTKFGDEALKVAEKNGYYIPTLEEFKMFQKTTKENREELNL